MLNDLKSARTYLEGTGHHLTVRTDHLSPDIVVAAQFLEVCSESGTTIARVCDVVVPVALHLVVAAVAVLRRVQPGAADDEVDSHLKSNLNFV